jgi:hypothetical protein
MTLWRDSLSSDTIDDMKAKTTAITALIIVMAMALPLWAQDQEGEGEVFAPYPSRIRVGVRGSDIVLSWEDSEDVTAGYAVFQHTQFPDESNFSGALLLGFADSGKIGYVHTPADEKPYYYFVLGRIPEAQVQGGESEYRLFIPLRNVPIDSISIKPSTTTALEAQTATQDSTPKLSGILARVDGDAVVVSIDAQGNTGRLVIYRGTAQIKSSASLLDAVLAAIMEPGSGPYRDYPVPGVDYYYAIVPEKDLIGGSVTLEAGVNTTLTAATIQAGTYRVGLPSASATSRSMPLPFLVLTKGFEDAKPVGIDDPTPEPRPLSAETEKAIATLAAIHASTTRAVRPQITMFPEDLQAGGGGEEYALRTIVAGPMAKGNYIEAAKEFTLYLSLPRSEKNAERARFYKGQCQAMAGMYREAFFDFLQSQGSYYLESSSWIDYILEELRRS